MIEEALLFTSAGAAFFRQENGEWRSVRLDTRDQLVDCDQTGFLIECGAEALRTTAKLADVEALRHELLVHVGRHRTFSLLLAGADRHLSVENRQRSIALAEKRMAADDALDFCRERLLSYSPPQEAVFDEAAAIAQKQSMTVCEGLYRLVCRCSRTIEPVSRVFKKHLYQRTTPEVDSLSAWEALVSFGVVALTVTNVSERKLDELQTLPEKFIQHPLLSKLQVVLRHASEELAADLRKNQETLGSVKESSDAAAERIWEEAKLQLRSMVCADTYNLWFTPIRASTMDGKNIVLEAANDFCRVWLKDNYMSLLQDVLSVASGRQIQIKFRVASTSSEAFPIAGEHASEPQAVEEWKFNPKNTFDSFIVGNNNNFAYAAALAVAQAPGKSYNPLFLYGSLGLGKTHLLHAIGQYIIEQKTGTRVDYVSSGKFTNEYSDAIQSNQLAKFRKKYRQTDVLLIDDIQFLAGKARIQEEFFHTFNALHGAHKQIVLTCDRPANEIQNLEHRMVSRIEWGLVTDLQPPDVEMRLAILNKKAQVMGVTLPEESMSFLANRIRTNIRRLEGALIRVASYSSMTGRKLTVELTERLLDEVLHEEGGHSINIETIQKKVAEHFDIRLADMTSKRRPEKIAFPRQIAMFLSRQLTETSLSAIGEAFGRIDNETVSNEYRAISDRLPHDPELRRLIESIKHTFKQSAE